MTWTAPTLEGELVRLEPMTPAHEDGLWEASRDSVLDDEWPEVRANLLRRLGR